MSRWNSYKSSFESRELNNEDDLQKPKYSSKPPKEPRLIESSYRDNLKFLENMKQHPYITLEFLDAWEAWFEIKESDLEFFASIPKDSCTLDEKEEALWDFFKSAKRSSNFLEKIRKELVESKKNDLNN